MSVLNVERALRSMQKTPVILRHVLANVGQVEAVEATDGPNGWSVLEIVCHLNDFEVIFRERIEMALAYDVPQLPPVDQNELARVHQYADQRLYDTLNTLLARRSDFVRYVAAFTEEQWQQRAIHPVAGDSSVLELVINVAIHDVDHTEQIISALSTLNK